MLSLELTSNTQLKASEAKAATKNPMMRVSVFPLALSLSLTLSHTLSLSLVYIDRFVQVTFLHTLFLLVSVFHSSLRYQHNIYINMQGIFEKELAEAKKVATAINQSLAEKQSRLLAREEELRRR
jgi:hypothetical protein